MLFIWPTNPMYALPRINKYIQYRDSNMQLRELHIHHDTDNATVWISMQPFYRQCFTFTLLQELQYVCDNLDRYGSPYAEVKGDVRYVVLHSSHPHLFNTGGDVYYFSRLVQKKDRKRLKQYAAACIDLIYWCLSGGQRGIDTIACVSGDALGGGFEVALACNYIIAEKHVCFGFPETQFGLFPGMSGFHLLARHIGTAAAEHAIRSGKHYSAEELYKKNIVAEIADSGQGRSKTEKFICNPREKCFTRLAQHKIKKFFSEVEYSYLRQAIELWIETVLLFNAREIRQMQTLAKQQERKTGDSH